MGAGVDLGRLAERSTVAGTDRTAYGRYVEAAGESASYAVGWSTDTDPPEGRVTVGIGAGTFHARVHERGDSWAYSLTDERFAEVGEGPHLTAEEARRHVDLPFVWRVAAVVMERDPRAQWMAHWMTGTVAVTTPQVATGAEPVLLIAHDGPDDGWILLGRTRVGDDRPLVHLSHFLDADATLLDVLDLAHGCGAMRRSVGEPWHRDPGR